MACMSPMPGGGPGGWAAAGHLQVLAGIPPVNCGAESIAGMVEVPIAELMPMFRRFGPSDEQGRLKRVKPLGTATWLNVTEPPDGLPIRSSDLLLAAGPLQQFEEERELLRRPANNMGANARYDWESMYALLTWYLFEKGVPPSQSALIALVQDWFV
ncbi:MAG: hypothetical protein B7Y02_15305, partial [Rhodobacterales bacterium 17-64-5]